MHRQPLSVPKKRTNVTISQSLLQEAKENGLNISALLELALDDALRQIRKNRYLRENKAAFASHNAFIEEAGLFSDDDGVI
ncbi:type II toxin-antitoxin system CcdA family antitoxin [Klebsiella aerogenes]|uniref:type II toxin-antitoxin system CcdA family antitoxin n=1 Tax=Klebsiella aerogenes TaxID=548 RepID=UPI0032DB2383